MRRKGNHKWVSRQARKARRRVQVSSTFKRQLVSHFVWEVVKRSGPRVSIRHVSEMWREAMESGDKFRAKQICAAGPSYLPLHVLQRRQ